MRSNRYNFDKRKVGQALHSFNSVTSNLKKVKAGRLLSLRVYCAEYFGHKFITTRTKNWECTELFMFVQGMGTLV